MSNRLTFSLASLIVLIAFGLVFAPMSVMAHDDATNAVDTPRIHPHPLPNLLSEQTDANGPTPGSAVAAHTGHPTVESIALKEVKDISSASKAMITADDGNTAVSENQLTLVVTFSRDVNTTNGNSVTVTSTDLIAFNDLGLRVRNANGVEVDASLTGGYRYPKVGRQCGV